MISLSMLHPAGCDAPRGHLNVSHRSAHINPWCTYLRKRPQSWFPVNSSLVLPFGKKKKKQARTSANIHWAHAPVHNPPPSTHTHPLPPIPSSRRIPGPFITGRPLTVTDGSARHWHSPSRRLIRPQQQTDSRSNMSSGGETAAINNLRHMITSARWGGGVRVQWWRCAWGVWGGYLRLKSKSGTEMSRRRGLGLVAAAAARGVRGGDSHASLNFNQVRGEDG